VIDETLLEAEEKMEKAVAVAKEEFGTIRTGRAHPSPFDKSSLSNIEKAIRNSDLGVNPSNDGAIIRVVFPELSEERRKDYIKVARHKAEDSRVSIRNIRRHAKDSLDKMVKAGDAGEDEVHRAQADLEELTHTYVGQVDDLLRHKEAELLEV
jgi:ribosome recycling factor